MVLHAQPQPSFFFFLKPGFQNISSVGTDKACNLGVIQLIMRASQKTQGQATSQGEAYGEAETAREPLHGEI